LNKVPPNNSEFEMAALGCAMLDKDAAECVFEQLNEECFYQPKHRKIFEAARTVYGRNDAVDIISVKTELARIGQLSEIGGDYYLTELIEKIPSTSNIEQYCNKMNNLSALRRLIILSREIENKCYEQEKSAVEIVEETDEKLLTTISTNTEQFEECGSVLYNVTDDMELRAQTPGKMHGIITGYSRLDSILCGIEANRLAILAGRPSHGKTAFALNVARKIALSGVPVGFVSLEMSKEQLMLRMLATDAKFDSSKARIGTIDKKDWPNIANSAGRLARMPLYIDDRCGQTVMQIKAKARRLVAQKKIKILIIDYLGLIDTQSKYNNKNIEIGTVTGKLKGMSKDFDIPVLVLCQLSRDIEKASSNNEATKKPKFRWPQNSDLRESGHIEQDADIVMFVIRPEMYGLREVTIDAGKEKKTYSTDNAAFISVTKNRDGRANVIVPFYFVPERIEFLEIEEKYHRTINNTI